MAMVPVCWFTWIDWRAKETGLRYWLTLGYREIGYGVSCNRRRGEQVGGTGAAGQVDGAGVVEVRSGTGSGRSNRRRFAGGSGVVEPPPKFPAAYGLMMAL